MPVKNESNCSNDGINTNAAGKTQVSPWDLLKLCSQQNVLTTLGEHLAPSFIPSRNYPCRSIHWHVSLSRFQILSTIKIKHHIKQLIKNVLIIIFVINHFKRYKYLSCRLHASIYYQREGRKKKSDIFKVPTIHITSQVLLEFSLFTVIGLPDAAALHASLISFDPESTESHVNWLNFRGGSYRCPCILWS